MRWTDLSRDELCRILETAGLQYDDCADTCFKKPYDATATILVDMLKLRLELEDSHRQPTARDYVRAKTDLDSLHYVLVSSIPDISKMAESLYRGQGILDKETVSAETAELMQDALRVFATVYDGKIMVCTPSLPSRQQKSGRYGNSEVKLYASLVRSAMQKIFREIMEIADSLGHKHLYFLNVFNEERNVPDNDNRDTGAIQNSICSFLPYGDTPDMTDVTFSGISTDLIPPSTFITVQRADELPPSKEDTIAFWINYYNAYIEGRNQLTV